MEEARIAVEAAERAAEESEKEARIAQEKAEESAQRTSEAATAEEELRQALAELHEQESTYNKKKQELEDKSEDGSLGVVQRNKAKNELSQHLAEDPLPLRRAKLTTAAATKKSRKS